MIGSSANSDARTTGARSGASVGLGMDADPMLFAIGRSVGRIGHAIEQDAAGQPGPPAGPVRRRLAGHGMRARLRQLPDGRVEQARFAAQRLVSTMRSRSDRHCANAVFCSAGAVRQLCGPIGDVNLQ